MLQKLKIIIDDTESSDLSKFYSLSHTSIKIHRHLLERILLVSHRVTDDRSEWRRIQSGSAWEVYSERSPLYWSSFAVHRFSAMLSRNFSVETGRNSNFEFIRNRLGDQRAHRLKGWADSTGTSLSFIRDQLDSLKGRVGYATNFGEYWPRTEALQFANRLKKVERFLLIFLGSSSRAISEDAFPSREDSDAKLLFIYSQQKLLNDFLSEKISEENFDDKATVAEIFEDEAGHSKWMEATQSELNKLSSQQEKMDAIVDLMKKNMHDVKTFDESIRKVLKINGRPSWFSRKWTQLSVFSVALAFGLSEGFSRRDLIKKAIVDAKISVVNFSKRFLEEPLLNIYNTIRHDTSNFAVMDPKSLNSDVDSLGRMVRDFAQKHGNFSPAQLAELEKSAKVGDIKPILSAYEQDIQNPIKAALFGDLVQLILVQVQKQRVDIERAMLAIDKLLKANELNFYALGLLPAATGVYFLLRFLWRRISGTPNSGQKLETIREELRTLERLLNTNIPEQFDQVSKEGNERNDLSVSESGRLLLSVDKLRKYSTSVGNNFRSEFLQDLGDLESGTNGVIKKQAIIDRMYHRYSFLNYK
eukprot:TRINITY_DN4448_c0_g1_i2.p1 TRINITY_DN4448_c0_g1~~TRINITY_DN4448_c0_g1_i2.p1  ORF type:complete len:587 (-),score=222.40 TRINITY_DN4448_c0_g1_i2:74-1834(-)